METPGYYAVIPSSVRYDASLVPNAKLLYGEITALCNSTGTCTAANDYFAELYNVDSKTISRWISQLRDAGYIDVEILKNVGNKRKITIDKKITRYTQKSHEVVTKKSIASDKKVTSIYENITYNNTINKERGALAFLEAEFPTKFEMVMMQYKSKIGNDFQKFAADFTDTVVIEGLNWEGDILFARLGKYARNWIENMNKAVQRNLQGDSDAKQTYRKNIV
ncbi:helix-turn-helix domain-containing protein [Flavobacterium sp. NRK1]|uniref:helix-turn-helix domain-containing protein n=1 Tax=Flavobacterium sp. NRK1 TaxID=2954929 RepID=UPI002091F885|nr:helix-turn-helix domain-containing protein [Flavobacterium sp. NRK1]MCO6149082.1 helix-turn-helix domain-containing protein [Flavobacterium sp. NRK1]